MGRHWPSPHSPRASAQPKPRRYSSGTYSAHPQCKRIQRRIASRRWAVKATRLDRQAVALLSPTRVKRLQWLDISKGLAIFVVVYFHFYKTYFEHRSVAWPDWGSLGPALVDFGRFAWYKVSELGFHAVGVFIILSGWALMQ